MSIKEHLQFLAMMVPTFLVLVALALSLAFPRSLGQASQNAAPQALIEQPEPLDTL
jgi:hypothetical protein